MSIFQQIQTLTKSLYPTGRAFKMPYTGFLDKMNNALISGEEQAYNDFVSILDSILPDNANFSAADADDWERRLGLPNGSSSTLADRKAAILRKLTQPGANPAKGHYQYIESQLQQANFNVYVYENIPAQTPFAVSGVNQTVQVQHGQIRHGQTNHGLVYTNKIANYIDEAKDLYFSLGGSYKSTFFVGGNPKGSFANVPLSRKNEFRELILKLKQVQDIGFLFINYI